MDVDGEGDGPSAAPFSLCSCVARDRIPAVSSGGVRDKSSRITAHGRPDLAALLDEPITARV